MLNLFIYIYLLQISRYDQNWSNLVSIINQSTSHAQISFAFEYVSVLGLSTLQTSLQTLKAALLSHSMRLQRQSTYTLIML